MYSRVIGPRRQGVMQGLLLQVASVGRTIAPIFMTQLFSNFGPLYAWTVEIIFILTAIIFVLLVYRRLVPLRTLGSMKVGDSAVYKLGTVYRF